MEHTYFGGVLSPKKRICAPVSHLNQKLETLTYMDFPYAHWSKLRSNNVIERLNRGIRCRTRIVGTFPDDKSALMLVCARLRHVASKAWGTRRYMSMTHLDEMLKEEADSAIS